MIIDARCYLCIFGNTTNKYVENQETGKLKPPDQWNLVRVYCAYNSSWTGNFKVETRVLGQNVTGWLIKLKWGKLRKWFHLKLQKILKYVGINLTKKVKGLYTENYKTLWKDIEEANNWKVVHVHGLEELTLLTRSPKTI